MVDAQIPDPDLAKAVFAAAGRVLHALRPDATVAHTFRPAPRTLCALASHPRGGAVAALFCEEAGAVLQVRATDLDGVRAVLATSFERIHRSNLVGLGVLPLQFLPGESAATLGLTGRETYTIEGLAGGPAPRSTMTRTALSLSAASSSSAQRSIISWQKALL